MTYDLCGEALKDDQSSAPSRHTTGDQFSQCEVNYEVENFTCSTSILQLIKEEQKIGRHFGLTASFSKDSWLDHKNKKKTSNVFYQKLNLF